MTCCGHRLCASQLCREPGCLLSFGNFSITALCPGFVQVLCMEFAAGGDLSDFVRSRRGLSEDLARWFFQQLIIAVDYTHRMVSATADQLPPHLTPPHPTPHHTRPSAHTTHTHWLPVVLLCMLQLHPRPGRFTRMPQAWGLLLLAHPLERSRCKPRREWSRRSGRSIVVHLDPSRGMLRAIASPIVPPFAGRKQPRPENGEHASGWQPAPAHQGERGRGRRPWPGQAGPSCTLCVGLSRKQC